MNGSWKQHQRSIANVVLAIEVIALLCMANFFRAEQASCSALPAVTSYTLMDGCRVQYGPGAWMSSRDWNRFGQYLFPQQQHVEARGL